MMRRLRHRGVQVIGVLVLFLILTIILTYPMVSYFSKAIPGPPWDGFQFLLFLHWFRTALFERHVSPWFQPEIFYPFGYNWFLSETMLSNIALAMPVNVLAGEVVAYNSLMWLSFVLSGLGAYLWTYHLTGQRAGGVISGVAFAFCAYRMQALSAGWPQSAATQWVPFVFLFAERSLSSRQWRDAVMAAFFYILNSLATWYYAFVVGLMLLLYVLVRLRPWREFLHNPLLWKCLVAFMLTTFLMLPAVMPMIQLWGQRQMRYSLPEVDWLCVSPEDFILPSGYHPLWGDLSLKWWHNWVPYYPWLIPGMVYLGMSVLCLAALSKGLREHKAQRVALVSIAVVASVLSLGLTLHVRSERVYIPVPSAWENIFHRLMIVLLKRVALNPVTSYAMPRGLGLYIPLPNLILFLFLPFFNSMRDWRRFALIPAFTIAILAGMGANRLLASRRAPVRAAVFVLVLLIVVVDLAAVPLPFGVSLVQPRPSDEWLAYQPGDFAVMQFPLRARAYGPSVYGIVTHRKKQAYGWGTFFPAGYASQLSTLASFPDAESIELLKSWTVKYILVGSTRYGDKWPSVEAGINARADLRLVAVLDEPSLYVAYRPGPMTGNVHDERWTADRVYIYEVLP